jgi:hypothetical protein
MEQYPDTIVISVAATPTQNSTTGLWTAGAATTYTLKCRVETNTAAKKLAGIDGTLIDYAFNCYLPLMTTVIPVGSAFVVGSVTGKVKGAKNGQLNSRLWL